MRRVIAAAGFATLVSLVLGSASVGADSSRTDLKNFQHVFVIMMENTSFDSIIGDPNAPWVNNAARTYGLATDYFGVTHPSQPNYLAATSGSNDGVTDDKNHPVSAVNIVDQIEASGRTWKAYMQSYHLCGADVLQATCGNQLYERKHNPFISYTDIQSNPARMANIVDFDQFGSDLASGNVADYVWISPDQCNDMHGRGAPASDPCSFANREPTIAAGDAFLSSTVSEIMASSAWTGNSVIFVVWDESDSTATGFPDSAGCCDSPVVNGSVSGGGHTLNIVISHSNHSPVTSSVAYNHYSMLATIEDGWQLGCIANTCDTVNVQPMADLVGPQG